MVHLFSFCWQPHTSSTGTRGLPPSLGAPCPNLACCPARGSRQVSWQYPSWCWWTPLSCPCGCYGAQGLSDAPLSETQHLWSHFKGLSYKEHGFNPKMRFSAFLRSLAGTQSSIRCLQHFGGMGRAGEGGERLVAEVAGACRRISACRIEHACGNRWVLKQLCNKCLCCP